MKSLDHQRQLMQIIGLILDGALSRLASQQKTSQENWFNLLKTAPRSWQNFGIGRACLFTHVYIHSLYDQPWTCFDPNDNLMCSLGITYTDMHL